jgi:hypothetical protein
VENIRKERERRKKKKGIKEAIDSMKSTIIDLDVSSSDISAEEDVIEEVVAASV